MRIFQKGEQNVVTNISVRSAVVVLSGQFVHMFASAVPLCDLDDVSNV